MEEYISDKQFRELSIQIHYDIELNKKNESKVNELKARLAALKHLRIKSMILEKDKTTQKGLL